MVFILIAAGVICFLLGLLLSLKNTSAFLREGGLLKEQVREAEDRLRDANLKSGQALEELQKKIDSVKAQSEKEIREAQSATEAIKAENAALMERVKKETDLTARLAELEREGRIEKEKYEKSLSLKNHEIGRLQMLVDELKSKIAGGKVEGAKEDTEVKVAEEQEVKADPEAKKGEGSHRDDTKTKQLLSLLDDKEKGHKDTR